MKRLRIRLPRPGDAGATAGRGQEIAEAAGDAAGEPWAKPADGAEPRWPRTLRPASWGHRDAAAEADDAWEGGRPTSSRTRRGGLRKLPRRRRSRRGGRRPPEIRRRGGCPTGKAIPVTVLGFASLLVSTPLRQRAFRPFSRRLPALQPLVRQHLVGRLRGGQPATQPDGVGCHGRGRARRRECPRAVQPPGHARHRGADDPGAQQAPARRPQVLRQAGAAVPGVTGHAVRRPFVCRDRQPTGADPADSHLGPRGHPVHRSRRGTR
jgi:hypothetical protein